jgi:aspartate racemase
MKQKLIIGLIGGMSWESSAEYYKLLNQGLKKRLGGFHSCHCIMESIDFDLVEKLQHQGDWKQLCDLMVRSAQNLERAGAGIVLLCTNTMHLCSDAIRGAIQVPFLHIAEATGRAIQLKGLKKVGLLGTSFTMEKDFYKGFIAENFGIEVITPGKEDRHLVHGVIYQELVHGEFTSESRNEFTRVILEMGKRGAQGVILGCTEIPLLIGPKDVSLPLFDTTSIHVEAALDRALGQDV